MAVTGAGPSVFRLKDAESALGGKPTVFDYFLAGDTTPPDAPVLWQLRRPELSPQVFAFVVCLVAGLLAAWAIVHFA